MIFPAFERPPPTTNTCGSITHETDAMAFPNNLMDSSTAARPALSPAFAASHTSFAVNPALRSSSVSTVLCAAMYFSATFTSPFADAYCSRQPFLPHPQHSDSSSIIGICPISPAAPFVPATIFPPRMIPPPTPVPRVIITTSS